MGSTRRNTNRTLDGTSDLDPSKLVQVERGIVDRRIFADQAIYEEEMEKIFARCWLYLGHESQIPNVGDYFTTYMGEDHVIVARDSHGNVRAFLNSCRHRGMRVCRADAGNTKTFLCPYHGWSYNVDGKLVGVPKYEVGYRGALDKERWGLIEVAQLDSFGGLIFATWDPSAPSLRDYLGGMAVYLDIMVNRTEGGLEVIGGTHKWRMPVNWKIPSENFLGDAYHLAITHGSAIEIGLRYHQTDRGHQIAVGHGHGFGSQEGGVHQGSAAEPSAYLEFLQRESQRVAARLGEGANRFVPLGHGNIFPHFSFLDATRFRTFRVWHPRGPSEIEVSAWCLVDKALPEELKETIRKQYVMTFGPSGMFEQDDGEIMGQITAGLRGYITRRQVFNYQMGLGHDRAVAEVYGGDWPGQMGGYWFEGNQREFYRRWRELMTADSASTPSSARSRASIPQS